MKNDIKHTDCEDKNTNFFSHLNPFKKDKGNTPSESLKEAVDAYLEETTSGSVGEEETKKEETRLLSNVLSLKNLDVTDIMIPRAEIVAIEVSSTNEEILAILNEKQFSRFPIYKETLDEILGSIHIKDILANMAKNIPLDLPSLLREIPIVSPAMPTFDLIHLMKRERRHMVLIVDEYGGIDGLATITDIIEELLGKIDDEYNIEHLSEIIKKPDDTYIIDARIDLEDLEEKTGLKFPVSEDDDIDTLGGLILSLAGRLPARGEIIDTPDMGVCFEILDADPRKIKKVHLIPKTHSSLLSSHDTV